MKLHNIVRRTLQENKNSLEWESSKLQEAKKPKEGDMVTWRKKGPSKMFSLEVLKRDGTAWLYDDDGEEYEAHVKDLAVAEGNTFGDALRKAREAGEDEFEIDGKVYKVKPAKNESTELEEGVSSFDKKKIIDAIKKGKKVKVTHMYIPAWKNIELGVSKEGIPYVHDFQGSEDISWSDIKKFKIESTELEENFSRATQNKLSKHRFQPDVGVPQKLEKRYGRGAVIQIWGVRPQTFGDHKDWIYLGVVDTAKSTQDFSKQSKFDGPYVYFAETEYGTTEMADEKTFMRWVNKEMKNPEYFGEDTATGDAAGYDKPLGSPRKRYEDDEMNEMEIKDMKEQESLEEAKGGHRVTFKTEGSKWKMFDVPQEVFRKFETGRIKYERWAKYLDLQDDTQKSIYDYACAKRGNTIVLRCGDTGALRAIRRRSADGR